MPRNLSKCVIGQCKYIFITTAGGGIINDPILLRLGENHFWLSLADSDVLLRANCPDCRAGRRSRPAWSRLSRQTRLSRGR